MERVLTLLKSGGLFLFFSQKTIAKKTIQMKSSESIFCKKWAFFRFLAEKIFSVAALECADCLRGVPGACGWTFLGACGWRRWRLCMFNLIYHLLLENHKWSRCSSGRVSVDSAAFFGYKFGYKILNSPNQAALRAQNS